MRASEKLAKALLKQIFPDMNVVLNDTAEVSGTYDFSLTNEGTPEQYAAVEVTTTIVEDKKKTAEIIKKNRIIESEKLRRDWHLYLSENFARLRNISGKLSEFEKYLIPIEESGIEKFFAPLDSMRNRSIEAIWTDLKVEAGFSYDNEEPKIVLSFCGSGGHVSSSRVQETVKRETSKEDNIKKFQQVPKGVEKHLLIIVDEETDYLTWRAITSGKYPLDKPVIPEEIDVVWLAAWMPETVRTYLIWKVSSIDGWKVLGEIKINQNICIKKPR